MAVPTLRASTKIALRPSVAMQKGDRSDAARCGPVRWMTAILFVCLTAVAMVPFIGIDSCSGRKLPGGPMLELSVIGTSIAHWD
jgi:hypothetical protein